MIKRNLKFVFSIVFILILCINNKVYASEANVSANNCTVGENFSVTINIPQDAIGYNGVVTVTYSDGSSASKNIYGLGQDMNDINADYYWPGNATVSFEAKVAGNATIVASNLNLTDRSGKKINSQSTVTTAVSIAGAPSAPTPSADANSNPAPASGGESSPNTNPAPAQPAAPKKITFKDTNEKMYTTKRVNIRQGYGTSSIVIQTLSEGVELTRTGTGSENVDGYAWSRVSYNGITGYVITSALTSTPPVPVETPEEPNENDPEQENEEVPTTEENGDSREEEIKRIAEELGSIPAVGKEEVIEYFIVTAVIIVGFIIAFKLEIYSLESKTKPLPLESEEYLLRRIQGKFDDLSPDELKEKIKYYDNIQKMRIKRERADRKIIRRIRRQDLRERRARKKAETKRG